MFRSHAVYPALGSEYDDDDVVPPLLAIILLLVCGCAGIVTDNLASGWVQLFGK